jgi:two-component system, NarL family, nitrate/nitrite response regulator NarL
MSAPVTVVVADDHPLYRASLVRSIRQHPRLTLLAEAADGRAALEAIREHRPDVALLDIKMPGVDGAQVADAVAQERGPTRMILLTGDVQGGALYAAIARGVRGLLSKLADEDELCDAILAVARGETVIAREAQDAVAAEIRLRGDDDRPVLTVREQEILALMADGASIPQMAQRLHLSRSTVKTHTEHLYRKLGVSDRAAAVAAAMRRGLLR